MRERNEKRMFYFSLCTSRKNWKCREQSRLFWSLKSSERSDVLPVSASMSAATSSCFCGFSFWTDKVFGTITSSSARGTLLRQLLYMLFLLYLTVGALVSLNLEAAAMHHLVCSVFVFVSGERPKKRLRKPAAASQRVWCPSAGWWLSRWTRARTPSARWVKRNSAFVRVFVSFCQVYSLCRVFLCENLYCPINIVHLQCFSSCSSLQPPPPGRCRKPTRSSETWREPSTWGGSSSSSTTGGSWRTSCSSSWLWPSSSPPSSTSLRSVSSLLFN